MVEDNNSQEQFYDEYLLDLFAAPAEGISGATIMTVPVSKQEFEMLKTQIKNGKTVLSVTKPDGMPQMWVIQPPYFSASVRHHKLSSNIYVPDARGNFVKREKNIILKNN